MELNAYQQLADRTANKDLSAEDSMLCGVLGLTGEAGEVSDYLKKTMFHGHELDESKLIAEIGDVLWYVALLATSLGVPLSTIAERNIEKLRVRYPEGFSSEASINRIA